MTPKFVTAHTAAGDYPAIVTRDNGDGTLNLMAFTDAGVVNRMSVREYEYDTDDEAGDKIGYCSV